MKKNHYELISGVCKIWKSQFFKKMRIVALLILISITQTFALDTYGQNTRLNLNVKNETIVNILEKIEDQSEFYFMFDASRINVDQRKSVDCENKYLTNVLDQLLENTGITYSVNDRQVLLTSVKSDMEQQNPVSGKVTDSSKQSLPGVTVIIKGTTNGTVTNMDGNYSISNVPDDAVLVFSFIGMKSQEVVVGNQSTINLAMQVDAIGIEEVVAIGYGTARKKDLTGSVVKINTEKLQDLPNVNAVQTLRGSVAGVKVIDDGRPGSDGNIIIRGKTSISAGNEPLIVLDGIPYTGGSLSDINSNDIESIDILKDASSAAIYGSRATNGVILITTKKGTSSKPQLNFNAYYGVSDFSHTPKMMGPEKYLQLKKDAEAYKGQPVQLEPLEEANYNAGITIDPWEEIKQDAPMQNYELSFSGKSETVSYYVSGSYTDVKGVVQGDNFSRLTLRSNFDVKIADWMKIGTNSGFTFKDYSGQQADIYFAYWVSPYANLYYDDGVPRPNPMNTGLVGNPLSPLLTDNKDIRQTLFSNVYTQIDLPVDGLSYRLNLGVTQGTGDRASYTPQFIRESYYSLGSGSKAHTKSQNFTLENILSYKKTFGDIHNLEATAMYGFETSKDEFSVLSSVNIFNDALGWNALEVGESFNIDTGAGDSKAVSAMARIGYRYGEKYMINATVRRDGYSAFGDGRKYGTFPSVGLGWNISEENFMKQFSWLDMLKLRVSYGKNGNRAIGRYATLSTMSQINYVYGDGGSTAIGLYPISMANPDLGWETTTSFNYGVDYNIRNSRISGSMEFYKMKTSDVLLRLRIPNMTGFEWLNTNVGGVENTGFELSLNSDNIRSKDFVWSSNLVFSLNRNKITKLSGNDNDGDGIEDDDVASGRFIGEPLGANFDYVWDGIWQEGDDMSIDPSARPGFVKFKDVSGPEGVPDGKIGPEDRQVLHSTDPDFLAGLTNSFSYKGFTLSFLLDLRYGGYKPNSLLNLGTNYFDAANVMDLPYWTPENPLEDRPSVGYPNPYGYRFYESLTFLRLQDFTVSYTFSKNITNRLKLNNLKAYISGKNLHTWTGWHGWDPEHGAAGRGRQGSGGNAEETGPLMRTWTFGINVGL